MRALALRESPRLIGKAKAKPNSKGAVSGKRSKNILDQKRDQFRRLRTETSHVIYPPFCKAHLLLPTRNLLILSRALAIHATAASSQLAASQVALSREVSRLSDPSLCLALQPAVTLAYRTTPTTPCPSPTPTLQPAILLSTTCAPYAPAWQRFYSTLSLLSPIHHSPKQFLAPTCVAPAREPLEIAPLLLPLTANIFLHLMWHADRQMYHRRRGR